MMRLLRRTPVRGLGVTVLALTVALALGAGAAVLGRDHLQLAIIGCLSPLLPWLILRTEAAVVVALACLPFEINVSGGVLGGLNIAPADIMLSAAFVGLLL